MKLYINWTDPTTLTVIGLILTAILVIIGVLTYMRMKASEGKNNKSTFKGTDNSQIATSQGESSPVTQTSGSNSPALVLQGANSPATIDNSTHTTITYNEINPANQSRSMVPFTLILGNFDRTRSIEEADGLLNQAITTYPQIASDNDIWTREQRLGSDYLDIGRIRFIAEKTFQLNRWFHPWHRPSRIPPPTHQYQRDIPVEHCLERAAYWLNESLKHGTDSSINDAITHFHLAEIAGMRGNLPQVLLHLDDRVNRAYSPSDKQNLTVLCFPCHRTEEVDDVGKRLGLSLPMKPEIIAASLRKQADDQNNQNIGNRSIVLLCIARKRDEWKDAPAPDHMCPVSVTPGDKPGPGSTTEWRADWHLRPLGDGIIGGQYKSEEIKATTEHELAQEIVKRFMVLRFMEY